MMNYEKIVRSEAKIRIMSALSILSIPIIQTLPIGEQGQFTNLQIYKFTNYLTPLLNSASVIAVAIATFRLSEVFASAG